MIVVIGRYDQPSASLEGTADLEGTSDLMLETIVSGLDTVSDISQAIRIRTGEDGAEAL